MNGNPAFYGESGFDPGVAVLLAALLWTGAQSVEAMLAMLASTYRIVEASESLERSGECSDGSFIVNSLNTARN